MEKTLGELLFENSVDMMRLYQNHQEVHEAYKRIYLQPYKTSEMGAEQFVNKLGESA